MAGAVKVDTAGLRNVSTAVSAVNTVYQTHAKIIKATFETLFSSAETWAGNDRDKCAKQCEELMRCLDEDTLDIAALAEDMQGIASQYESLEQLTVGIANSQIVY